MEDSRQADVADRYLVPTLVALVGVAVVVFLYRFNPLPTSYEHYIVVNLVALFFLPMLLILTALRRAPDTFGFGLGDLAKGYKLAGLLFLGALPFLIIASRMSAFQDYYPIQKQAAYSFRYFMYFELSYGLYLFCWEFFFRGFLLFGLARAIGTWSVFVQAVAFGIMHIGKPPAEVAASFAAGVILGLFALRAKSFVPCFVLHWATAVTFDLLVIAALRGSWL